MGVMGASEAASYDTMMLMQEWIIGKTLRIPFPLMLTDAEHLEVLGGENWKHFIDQRKIQKYLCKEAVGVRGLMGAEFQVQSRTRRQGSQVCCGANQTG